MSNDEDVFSSGREGASREISNSADIERAGVVLDMGQSSHTAGVTTLGDHNGVTDIESDDSVGEYLSRVDFDLDSVVYPDGGIGVPNSAAVVGDYVGDSLIGETNSLNSAQLIFLLVLVNSVEDESALGVVDEAEDVVGFLDLDNVHETSGEVGV